MIPMTMKPDINSVSFITKSGCLRTCQVLDSASISAVKKNAPVKKQYDILLDLANAQKNSGDDNDALKTLEKAKLLEPQLVKAYNEKGKIHDDRKEIVKAEKEYKAAIKKDPRDPEA